MVAAANENWTVSVTVIVCIDCILLVQVCIRGYLSTVAILIHRCLSIGASWCHKATLSVF